MIHVYCCFLLLMILRPSRSTRTSTRLPYTPLFRSGPEHGAEAVEVGDCERAGLGYGHGAALGAPHDRAGQVEQRGADRKSRRLNSSQECASRMPSSA